MTAEKKQLSCCCFVLYCLFNAAMLFRAAVNTVYFLEDAGKDYTEITATVTELQLEQDPADNKKLITPVFSFDYKGEMMTRKAPSLQYVVTRESGSAPYRVGDVVSLWIHDFQGYFIVPPKLSRRDSGISQLVVTDTRARHWFWIEKRCPTTHGWKS